MNIRQGGSNSSIHVTKTLYVPFDLMQRRISLKTNEYEYTKLDYKGCRFIFRTKTILLALMARIWAIQSSRSFSVSQDIM
jgi:hypothetical protein